MPALANRRHQMLELARRWQESGASARVFAQERGVSPWMLYYWRERLTSEHQPTGGSGRPSATCLAPVQIIGTDVMSGDLEIVLTRGDRIRVPATVSMETLRRVIQVLRTEC